MRRRADRIPGVSPRLHLACFFGNLSMGGCYCISRFLAFNSYAAPAQRKQVGNHIQFKASFRKQTSPQVVPRWLWAEPGASLAAGVPGSLHRGVSQMTPTSHDYQRSAWRNGFESGLTFRVSLEAWESATTEDHTNGKQFDDNVTAAIQAGEWLDRAVTRYRG